MTKFNLNNSVRVIPGVGEKNQEELERMGIHTLEDLLYWFPRSYLDGTQIVDISSLRHGQIATIKADVIRVNRRKSQARAVPMLEVVFSDDSGEVLARWFHQDYLVSKLIVGSSWVLIGQIQRFRGEAVMLSPLLEKEEKIWSIYRQTKTVTTRMLRTYLNWTLANCELVDSFLPSDILASQQLVELGEAMGGIHQPRIMDEVSISRERFAFEEMFWFFVGLQKEDIQDSRLGTAIETDLDFLKERIALLPFQLTDDQKKCLWQIVQDMALDKPMVRLLNGDVGSGKTVVAVMASVMAAKAGMQTVILVPTEVLAQQHFATITKLVGDSLKVGIWTANKKDGLEADIVIGTHALLQKGVELPNIGLVIIDEQHRFGVEQRKVLSSSRKDGRFPHLLSMTATPIPRTLALTMYGNLKISFLKSKPANRLPLRTEIIEEIHRDRMYDLIRREIGAKHLALIICPLITEKQQASPDEGQIELGFEDVLKQEKKTVEAEVERLQDPLLGLGVVAGLHGKMKSKEKNLIMERAAKGEIDVLVSTTVVEVGVDLPLATVIAVEGAENFGLAQLHQLRGRVGRSNLQSYCFLCPGKLSDKIRERLMVLVREESGFAVADYDLSMRGPGELAGFSQSGLPDFKFASLSNIEYISNVKSVAVSYCETVGRKYLLELENRYLQKNKILE